MIPAPKGVKPIEIVSKSKIETKEQIPAPKGVVPIEEPKSKEGWKEKFPTIKKPEDAKSNVLSSDFKKCTGFNQMGCSSESIKEVQKCLQLPETGNFDKTLYNELGLYGWQNGFNDSDVTRVCDVIKRKKEEKAKIELKKKEEEDFYKKFPKTSKGSEVLDLS